MRILIITFSFLSGNVSSFYYLITILFVINLCLPENSIDKIKYEYFVLVYKNIFSSNLILFSRFIKFLDHFRVTSVRRSLARRVIWMSTEEYIQERNLMFVISVDQDTLEKAWGLHYINFNRIFLKAFLLILS